MGSYIEEEVRAKVHYVTFLDDRSQKISRSKKRFSIRLRGYNPKTWVPPEFMHIKLPVNVLAFSPCPTHRDVFLEKVQGLQRPFTWDRYRGKLIDETYKLVHKACEEYISSTTTSLRNFDLCQHIIGRQTDLLSQAKRPHARDLTAVNPTPSEAQVSDLDEELKKIIAFEATLTSTFMNFQIAKTSAPRLSRIFEQFFDFNVDLSLCAPHQGFETDVTPDFIYKHQVVGDIKSGRWQEFFLQTVAAYALAYEEHIQQNINYGVIFHVDIPSSRRVPIHFKTRIEPLTDQIRERYITVRNRKLEIIDKGSDPLVPQNRDKCDPDCPFGSDCW
jgi:CRISPR/Cas system-associated exonuclease Cas4 (RecB family)